MDPTRRQVLITALSSGLVAACTSRTRVPPSGSTPAAAGTGVTPTTSVPAPPGATAVVATSSTVQLPAAHPWVARRGEVQPAVKARATSLLEAVGTWSDGQGDLPSARRRAAAAGHAPSLADGLAVLLGSAKSAVTVVRDAQYGGILSGAASVLVVVDQWRASSSAVVAGGTTVDVRLVAASPHWRITEVLPAKPGSAVAAPSLSSTARRVLADGRIRLPYAARADVRAGRIHDSVLALLLSMSQGHVVDVSVLRSGHPVTVFGTSRPSDHPRGRAVDVWALDGRALVLPTNHVLAAQGMRYAVAHGAYNVGGPVLLSGREYFSDRTHQDHIHLGFAS